MDRGAASKVQCICGFFQEKSTAGGKKLAVVARVDRGMRVAQMEERGLKEDALALRRLQVLGEKDVAAKNKREKQVLVTIKWEKHLAEMYRREALAKGAAPRT